MKNLFFLLILSKLISCNNYNSKWEEIKGMGVSNEETLDNAIYFQDSLRGIIGGYKLLENKNSKNFDKLDIIPVLYFTKNGGKNWKLINIKNVEGGVDNVKLENDTIICQIDDVLYKSKNLGLTWDLIEKSSSIKISEKYFPNSDRYNILNDNFQFKNKKYRIKEIYKNKDVKVIVCYDREKSMTNYYFITKNSSENWTFLQNEFGSNKMKFILKDEYLFAYDSQYGLQKLKLK